MSLSAIDNSQRTAAKIAGLAGLVSFAVLVAVNYGIFAAMLAGSSASEIARRVLADETSFRAGLAGNILYVAGTVVVLTALYIILKPINQTLALLAAFGRLIYGFMMLAVTLNLFTALRILKDPQGEWSAVFSPEQVAGLACQHLRNYDAYYIGLIFWGLSAAAASVLWFKSRYIPRGLAGFGLIASVWCAACTFIYYIFPGFEKVVGRSWFDSPLVLFELALSFWLLFKGLRTAP